MRLLSIFAAFLALAGFGPASAQDRAVGSPGAWGCNNVGPQPTTLPGAMSFTYETVGGRALRIHVFAPPGRAAPRPAIVFFFGGGWRTGTVAAFLDQARAMAAHGLVAALADYRVSCRDNSTPADSVADAEAAFAWMKQQARLLDIDPTRVVLSGGSAGGHLALTTAMLEPPGQRPAALVLFNPVVDLVAMAPRVNLTAAQARAISPSALPVQNLPPMVIFHGTSDRTVPIETVRAFCARVVAAGGTCELHEYAGMDHGFFNSHAIDPYIAATPYDDTLARAIAFLERLRLTAPVS